MGDPCPAWKRKSARLIELQERQKEICLELNQSYIGKNMRVLVEKRATSGELLARTAGNQRVFIQGDDALIGHFIRLLITDAGPADLRGDYHSVYIRQHSDTQVQ